MASSSDLVLPLVRPIFRPSFHPQLVRVPLAQVPSEKRMVESLASMWAEESERSGGAVPRAPPSPPRHPASLCEAVDATRAGFQAVADAQRADIRGAEESTPVLATPPPPARVALLALTQPANLSALGASPAARASALRGAGGAGLGPSPLLARLASPEPGNAGVALVDTGALAALFSRLPPAAGARGQAERQARGGDLGAAGSGSDVEEDGRGAPGNADEDDADEDMLLRLAAQGAVLGTQFTPGLEGGHPVSRGGRTPLAAPAEVQGVSGWGGACLSQHTGLPRPARLDSRAVLLHTLFNECLGPEGAFDLHCLLQAALISEQGDAAPA